MTTDKDKSGAVGKRRRGGRPPGGSKREVRLEELYETAARLFNERGFHGTSLQDLASRLGVTKAALYHYVSNKQDLLYRLHVISLGAAEAATERAIAEGRTGIERVRLVVYHYLDAICASPTACLILLEEDALRPDQSAEILNLRRRLEYGLRDLIRSGIEDGTIIPCDPKLATFVLVGAMNWVTQWYRPGGDWNAHQVADGISALLARSLSTTPVPELPADISRPHLTPFALPPTLPRETKS